MISRIIQTELLVSAEAKLIETDYNKEVRIILDIMRIILEIMRIILDIGFILSNTGFFLASPWRLVAIYIMMYGQLAWHNTRSRPL